MTTLIFFKFYQSQHYCWIALSNGEHGESYRGPCHLWFPSSNPFCSHSRSCKVLQKNSGVRPFCSREGNCYGLLWHATAWLLYWAVLDSLEFPAPSGKVCVAWNISIYIYQYAWNRHQSTGNGAPAAPLLQPCWLVDWRKWSNWQIWQWLSRRTWSHPKLVKVALKKSHWPSKNSTGSARRSSSSCITRVT